MTVYGSVLVSQCMINECPCNVPSRRMTSECDKQDNSVTILQSGTSALLYHIHLPMSQL